MAAPKKYPDELRVRAVREVTDSDQPVAEPGRANEILKAASVCFAKEL